MAFRTSRTFTVRGRPPRLAGGISEPTSAHSASVKSLSYQRPRRSAAAAGRAPAEYQLAMLIQGGAGMCSPAFRRFLYSRKRLAGRAGAAADDRRLSRAAN